MRILSLDRLVGPGQSIGENFEILCLELVKATAGPLSQYFRNSSPDRGVDIYYENDNGVVYAYQCKAYSTFRANLISSLKKSIKAANHSFEKKPWDYYVLIIPFVPTAGQRDRLEEVLKTCKGKSHIIDGDEIETRLFYSLEIASRFFPTVTVAIPPDNEEIILKTGDNCRIIRTYLQSIRTGQRIAILASADATCNGLVNLLNSILKLPDMVIVSALGLPVSKEEIHWQLSVVRDGKEVKLSPEMSLEQAGVREGNTLRLSYHTEIKFTGGFMKEIGPPLKYESFLDSRSWDEEEMNPKLIRGTKKVNELLIDYIEWHLKDLKMNNSSVR